MAAFDGDVGLTVEVAFGYGPFDTPSWTDVSTRCRGLSFSRGRNNELDRIEAGTARFVFDNQDGALNANNTSSAFYPNVKVMVPIRVTAEHDSITYPLWYGFVESWPVSFPGHVDSIVTVNAVDAFKLFALADASTGKRSEVVAALDPDAWWRFSGDPGTEDSSGNSHTLTFAGTPNLEEAGVWPGDEAVTFDGTDDAATVANEAVLEYVDADMTIEVWFKVAPGGSGVIATCDNATPSNQTWQLDWGSGFLDFVMGGFGTLVAAAEDVWHHVAVTRSYSGGTATITIYLNGVASVPSTETVVLGAATRTVRIGRADSGSFFDGDISEIALWGRALTAGEVSELYNARFEAFAEERTDQRVETLLENFAGFTTHDLEVGQSTMAATVNEGSILSQIGDAVDTEGGLFFIAGDGTARFHDRHYRLLNQVASLGTFADTGSDLPYFDIVLSYDDSKIWNEIVVEAGESTFTAADTTSQLAYGKRTLALSTFPANENEGFDRARWTLGLYKEPGTRIDSLAITPQKDGDNLWPVILGMEIGNRYTVTKTAAGDDLTQDVYLEAVSMEIAPKQWRVNCQLSPVTAQAWWVLEDPVLGILDETTKLAF